MKKYNLKPVGDEEFWNAHEDIQAKSPADAEKLEQLATELMELDGQTTMTAWGHFDKRTVAKVAKKLLDKGEVELAREVLKLSKKDAVEQAMQQVEDLISGLLEEGTVGTQADYEKLMDEIIKYCQESKETAGELNWGDEW